MHQPEAPKHYLLGFDAAQVFVPAVLPTIEQYLLGRIVAAEGARRLGWPRDLWDRSFAGIFCHARDPQESAATIARVERDRSSIITHKHVAWLHYMIANVPMQDNALAHLRQLAGELQMTYFPCAACKERDAGTDRLCGECRRAGATAPGRMSEIPY